jgi:hypothetical protein
MIMEKLKTWTPEELFAVPRGEVEESAAALVQELNAVIRGKHPGAQGIAVCMVAAQWIAGHDEATRADVMEAFTETISELVPKLAEELWAAVHSDS